MKNNLEEKKINPVDVFARACDDLLERLIAGSIPARRVDAALAKFVALLVGVGFKESEARAAFADAVSTYEILKEEGAV